jgi:hypothetical protein
MVHAVTPRSIRARGRPDSGRCRASWRSPRAVRLICGASSRIANRPIRLSDVGKRDSASDKASTLLFGRNFRGILPCGNVLCGVSPVGQGGTACHTWAGARCLSGQSWEPEDDGPPHRCRRAHCRYHCTSLRVRMEQVCRCGLSINHRRAIQRSTAEQAGAATQALLAEHLPTAACSNAKSQLSAQLARLRWQTVRLGLPDCSQSSD